MYFEKARCNPTKNKLLNMENASMKLTPGHDTYYSFPYKNTMDFCDFFEIS